MTVTALHVNTILLALQGILLAGMVRVISFKLTASSDGSTNTIDYRWTRNSYYNS